LKSTSHGGKEHTPAQVKIHLGMAEIFPQRIKLTNPNHSLTFYTWFGLRSIWSMAQPHNFKTYFVLFVADD
jgi:hypothetical protein